MKGDFSRNTFQPQKNYRAVRMQQGRVILDADWNEMVDIANAQHAAALRNMIGAHGGLGDGFKVTFAGKKTTWSEESVADTDQPVICLHAGQYYANGYACTLAKTISFEEQPYFPGATDHKQDALAKEDSNQWLLYLDVWERHLTAIEDPELPEPALGGADTTTRTQMVWQVKLLRIEDKDQPINLQKLVELSEWQHLIRSQNHPIQVKEGFATENELFRIEIHAGNDDDNDGATDPALKLVTWKWSRDNASIAFPLRDIQPLKNSKEPEENDRLVLTLAADPRLQEQLRKGDCVELECDQWVLNGVPGWLGKIEQMSDETDQHKLVIRVPGSVTDKDTNKAPASFQDPSQQHFLIRRWDQRTDNKENTKDNYLVDRDHQIRLLDGSLEILLPEEQVSLEQGDWVELAGIRAGKTWQAGQVQEVAKDGKFRKIKVNLAQPLPNEMKIEEIEQQVQMRRWDHAANPMIPSVSHDLEHGITVQFPPGRYRTGDYWLIPIRSGANPLDKFPVPQANAIHTYAPLALLTRQVAESKTEWEINDYRRLFLDLGDVFARLESLQIELENTKKKLADLHVETDIEDEEQEDEISVLRKDVSNLKTKVGQLPILTIQRYAGRYRSHEKLEPGDVVSSQGSILQRASRQAAPVGVIAPRSEDLEADEYSVVLSGPVLCRIQGHVQADDLLVPALEPGALKRASLWVRWFAPYRIVARAIDSPTSPRDRFINVYFRPDFTGPED